VLSELPILSVDEIIERIDAVELSDLEELASELFARERLSVAGVGSDKGTFDVALRPLEGVAS
jgi:predicted Zn-dependent peptidase